MAFRARSGRDLLCRCCCWKANGSCSLSVRCQLIGSSEWIARTSVLAMLQVQARLQHAPPSQQQPRCATTRVHRLSDNTECRALLTDAAARYLHPPRTQYTPHMCLNARFGTAREDRAHRSGWTRSSRGGRHRACSSWGRCRGGARRTTGPPSREACL